jgi:dolichol-phosphate mannosyltransferase
MTTDHSGVPGRVLVVIPTYDEHENLLIAIERLRAAVPDADLLVVDDGSPDGTGQLAEEIAVQQADQSGRDVVHVIHRTGKLGLGTAYIAGFRWALERGYDVVVEMDADGSHSAEDLPRLLAAVPDADLVIGSRWMPGGRVVNWPRSREVLSRGANIYTQLALGLPVHDATAGFRAYHTDMLKQLALDEVSSHGYCFQIDMTWRVQRAGGRTVEVPITFAERERGQSKMSRTIIVEALVNVTVWGIQERSRQVRAAVRHLRRG